MAILKNYEAEIQSLQDAYIKRGHKEAASNRPPTDSTQLDQNESELFAKAEKHIVTELHLFSTVTNNANGSVQDLEQKTVSLKTKCDQLLGEGPLSTSVEMDLASDRNDLILVTEKQMLAELDWKYFRANHSITEQAVYPESFILHIAIILILAFLETIANAFFYENSQGLLGGFMVAVGVSVVNMGSALLFGFFFRHKNLRTPKDRVFGWACMILFVGSSLYCNALFASFRSQYQLLADPTNSLHVSEAFKIAALEANNIFILKMQFLDLMSFILFGFGLFLSIIAFYKGYTLDDKYPGYGKLDKRLKSARELKSEKQIAITGKIKELLVRKRGEVQSVINEPATLINMAAFRVSDLGSAISNLNSRVKNIQLDFAMVLQAYRKANVSVRVTPPPEYFVETPDLTEKIQDANCDTSLEQLNSIQVNLAQIREQNQEALNNKLQALEAESASVLTTLVPQFFVNVDEEVQFKITRSSNPR